MSDEPTAGDQKQASTNSTGSANVDETGDSEPLGVDEIISDLEESGIDFGDPDTEGEDGPVLQTTADSDPLGHVIASDGLQVGRNGHIVQSYVETGTRDHLRVGDYAQVPYPETMGDRHAELFGVVDELRYEQRADFDDKSDTRRGLTEDGIDERQYVEVADIEPIGVIEGDEPDSYERVSVDRVPKPFTRTYRATDESLLRTGLNLPEFGQFAGWLAVSGDPIPRDDPLAVRLPDGTGEQPPSLYQHGLVAGANGTGKSHVTKNLLRQYAVSTTYPIEVEVADGDREERERPLGIIVIDPENEYAGLADDPADLPAEKREELEAAGIEVGGINTGACGSHDCRVYVPMVDDVTAPAVDGAREFGLPFSLVESRVDLLLPYGAEEPTKRALEACLDDYFDDTIDPTYADFIRYLEDEEDNLCTQHNINQNMWDAMQRRVVRNDHYRVFDSTDTMLTDITDELFRPGRVTIIPTKHLSGVREEIIVMGFLSTVVHSKLTDAAGADQHISGTPLMVCVDEAHEYLSGADSLRGQSVVEDFQRIAKRGRKHKLGLLLVTQDPGDIDDEIRGQLRTRVYLQMEEETASQVAVPSQFTDDITTFTKGQMVVKAPDVQPIEVKGLDYCLVDH